METDTMNQQDDADLELQEGVNDTGTDTGEDESSARTMPDEAYKGLQRRLAREQKQRAELEAELSRHRSAAAGNQTGNGIDPTIVAGLLQEVQKHDPERARALALAVQQRALQQENEALKGARLTESQEAMLRQTVQRNDEALRNLAEDLGVNPEHPDIDYGGNMEPIWERIEKVRETAKAIIKRQGTAKRKSGDGTAHNTGTSGSSGGGRKYTPTDVSKMSRADMLKLSDEEFLKLVEAAAAG